MRNTVRSVESIHRGGETHWVGDGFRVQTVFPAEHLPAERVSPFVLLDFHPAYTYPAQADGKRGVGWHPHRGFETVSVAFQGEVDHRDTAGHQGHIGPGDVQWMTAGKGLLHEEYQGETLTRKGGVFEFLQLWVNLPRRDKMTAPKYQPITAETIPLVPVEGGTVRVIAGDFQGHRGPAQTFTPVTLLDARVDGPLGVDLPREHNAMLLVVDGEIVVGGHTARAGELVLLANDGERAELTGKAHVVVLAGEPLDEPIVQYGPFVMNTPQEIMQAVRDFNRGDFGRVPAER